MFVSIGTPEKLQTFLELNPHVPQNSILVDDYEHKLYKRLGYTRFDEVDDVSKIKPIKLFGLFDLGVGGLWNYATRFLEMAPVEGGVDWTELPEGGMRNGGTLVVTGDEVVYQWADTIPSDVPDVEEVLQIAKTAASRSRG